jgi:uncharacterized protein YrrD
MQLKQGIDIYTQNGDRVGQLSRVVIDPQSKRVTHLVVEKGFFFPEDRVVPIEAVGSTGDDRVTLSGDISMQELAPFEVTHYVDADREEWDTGAYPSQAFVPSFYWYPPVGTPGRTGFPAPAYGVNRPATETRRTIPEETVALQEGADVVSRDGRPLGSIEQVFADPESNRVTHFVIAQGMLFKDRKMVPANWVDVIDEDRVYLSVGSKTLERLPTFEA